MRLVVDFQIVLQVALGAAPAEQTPDHLAADHFSEMARKLGQIAAVAAAQSEEALVEGPCFAAALAQNQKTAAAVASDLDQTKRQELCHSVPGSLSAAPGQGGTADQAEDPDQPCPACSAVQAVAGSYPTSRGHQEGTELRSGIGPAGHWVCLACLDLVEVQDRAGEDRAGEDLTGRADRRCRGSRPSP